MKLWVDDDDWSGTREPPTTEWVWAKTSAEALAYLETGTVQEISLDHDLGMNDQGEDDTTRRLVLWMCENDAFPEVLYVHTANRVGREWLVSMINRYGPGVTTRWK